MNDAPLFQLHQLRKQYGDRLAVDVEQLSVQPGEILCLLGPTGAGKSSLLKILATLDAPSSGQVVLSGHPLLAETVPLDTRRRMTMVFQRPLLLRGTVNANVEYGLQIRQASRDSARKVSAMLQRLGAENLAEQAAHTLSGGQMQVVALARALVLEPEILLLDEPTANLDPAYVALVERVIQEEWQRRQTTIVWATHNLFQARRVAQRVALLLNGRLVEVATQDQFFHAPRDPRTKDFVEGKMVY